MRTTGRSPESGPRNTPQEGKLKRGTTRHPKVFDLMEALDIPRPLAVGYLEMLWHFTAEFAPQGDIGRYSDSRIEGSMDWRGKPGKLLSALTTTKWVDRDRSTRIVVHDWEEHCDDAVRKKLKRAGLSFVKHTPEVTGQNPPMSGTVVDPCPPALPSQALPEPLPPPPNGAFPPVAYSEWPETAAAVAAVDPATNGIFTARLVQTVLQAALSDGKVNMPDVTDNAIARAVQESVATFTGRGRHGAGLLLRRVPEIIINWGHEDNGTQ